MSFDFSSIVEPVREAFDKCSKSLNGKLEIEGRLGIYDSEEKKFDTNIGEEHYTSIKSLLDSCKEWSKIDNAKCTDYFHDKMRYTIDDTDATKQYCIVKKKLSSFTFVNESSPLDFRISMSVEIPVRLDLFPIKNKSSLKYRNKDRFQYCLDNYSYDLTKIVTREGKEKVEYFEYEVEQISPDKNMGQTIFSIIMKLLDATNSCDGFVKTRDNSLPMENLNIRIV